MFDVMKKLALTGVGLALKTRKEVEDFAKDFVEQAKLSEKEGEKFFDDMVKRYDDSKGKFEERVEGVVKDVLKKMNLATQSEVMQLKDEIEKIKNTAENSEK